MPEITQRKDEPILDYVVRRLNAARGDWPRIAEQTGVPYGTVVNIAQAKSTNPTIHSLQPLLDYFAAFDAMVEGLKRGPATAAAVSG